MTSSTKPLRLFAAATVTFAGLAAVISWPQVRHLSRGIVFHQDPFYSVWRLAWIAHQVVRHPAGLFDANIYYPARGTLAFGETMLVPGLITAPLFWLGVPAILVYNMSLLGALIASGLGMYLLVTRLTGNPAAGIGSGVIFAFAPYRFEHYMHLELQWACWIPLALWALDRTLERGSWADGLMTGAFVAAQAMSSLYYGIFLATFLPVIGVVAILFRFGVHRRAIAPLASGALLAAAIVLPYTHPYVQSRSIVGARTVEDARTFSAHLTSYLSPPWNNLLYHPWTDRFGAIGELHLFPGIVAVTLAILGIWPLTDWRRAAYLAGLLIAFDASLGYNGLTYPWLRDHVLAYEALRVPARWAMLVCASLAVLAGFGIARLQSLAASRARTAVMIAIVCALTAEYANREIPLRVMPAELEPLHAALRRLPPGAIVDLPVTTPDRLLTTPDPLYMYYSTFHWQPLVNGYGGFFPPAYMELLGAMRSFPDRLSKELLRSRGATYIVLDADIYAAMQPGAYAKTTSSLDADPELMLVGRIAGAGGGSIYRFR